ncbi:MAG: hypothetical protein HUJ61_02800, partial [Bacilli bacterium]|nr:hypothetical protein [Bacilli bacterium]
VLNYTTGDEVEVLGGSKFIWNHMETPGLDLQINARGGQAMVGEEKVGIYYTVNLPLFQYSNYQAISFFIAAGNFSYGQLVFNDGVSTYKTDRLNGFDFSASRPDPAYHQVSIKDGKLYFDRVDIGVSVSNDVLVGNEKFSFKIFTPFSSVNGDGSYAYADGYMKMSGLYSHLELEE